MEDENGGKSTVIHNSPRFWVKNQTEKNSAWGSYLPALSFSDMCFVGEDLFIFMGFDRNYNKNTNDVFQIKHLKEDGAKKEILIIPHPETVNNTSTPMPPDFKVQAGFLPGSRAGHKVFQIGNTEVILLGGHDLRSNGKTPVKSFVHPDKNIHIFIQIIIIGVKLYCQMKIKS